MLQIRDQSPTGAPTPERQGDSFPKEKRYAPYGFLNRIKPASGRRSRRAKIRTALKQQV